MSKSPHKLREIVQYLSDQLTRGWAALWVAQQIDGARQSGRLRNAHAFWGTTYEASVESAILALARLIVPHKDAISVEYLLNCVYQSPSAFPRPEREAVMRTVAQHRALLGAIGPLVDRVKNHRDRTIAHLDKRHVNQQDLLESQRPIDLDEIERAFGRILAVLNAYRVYLDQPSVQLADLRAGLSEDWTDLLRLIEKEAQS